MINILNMDHRVNLPWCRDEFLKYIKPSDKVLIVPFSFREEEIQSIEDWDKLYKPGVGLYYIGLEDQFMSYGILQENLSVLHYLEDTRKDMIHKIKHSTILYFTGGLPTLFYQRLIRFDLLPTLREYEGVVIGTSAGAMIQLKEYLITPDDDYNEVSIEPGIGMISSFCIEAHYRESVIQVEAITEYVDKTGKDLYAITDQGAIIVNKNDITLVGDVIKFTKQ